MLVSSFLFLFPVVSVSRHALSAFQAESEVRLELSSCNLPIFQYLAAYVVFFLDLRELSVPR
jgi:hypothetical protein